ncbi:MAG: hypothetical protein AAB455_00015 [Patescibacteria group bacterium]
MTEVADDVLGRFARQQHDWFRRVKEGSLDPEEIYRAVNPLVQNGRPDGKSKRRRAKTPTHSDFTLHLFDHWVDFWRVVGGRTLTGLTLPTPTTGLTLPVVTPSDLTADQLYDLTVGTKFFSCWKYRDDLNALCVKEPHLQAIDQAVVILVRPVIEANQDLPISYDQAVAEKRSFISIRQRIIMEPFAFWLNLVHPNEAQKFGIPKHFDPKNSWTRTSSLAPGGRVASGRWFEASGRFRVYWSNHGNALPHGGLRQAVA